MLTVRVHAAEFWHGFPDDAMTIFVVPRSGVGGVPYGRAMSGGSVSMVIYVGEHATGAQLQQDWMLLHELVHVGSPFVYRAPWLMEGLATYIEPLIRACSGLQSANAMWIEFMTYMPKGAAVMGTAGLAGGGRRGWYWGGALLMLLADLQMRRMSNGRSGLKDCLREIRVNIGNYAHTLSLPEMVSACDTAVGGSVMRELVDRYVMNATAVDLERLWRDLGLRLDNARIIVNDDAPLAKLRDAIVRGSGR